MTSASDEDLATDGPAAHVPGHGGKASDSPPVTTYAGTRKTVREGEPGAPAVELRDGVWHVRSLRLVRQVLRDGGSVRQAGFNAEAIPAAMAKPLIYHDGEPHRLMRSGIARYFAPKTVATRYVDLMESLADRLVADIADAGGCRLDEVTMRYSVEIAAQVIGLTESDMSRMARRLARFFSTPLVRPAPDARASAPRRVCDRVATARMALVGQRHLWVFFLRDVRPAIRARRSRPADDVISHCLQRGYSDVQILMECVMYGSAGMVTTREFIAMATWHLLADPALREAYLDGDREQRYAVLQEILRLEPVVGHLFRRARSELQLTDGDTTHVVPPGALLDLSVRAANADPVDVGPDALTMCPGRALPPRMSGAVMGFGDGPHKCPGNHVALQESDVLLRRLLRLPLVIDAEPTVGWDDLISGYELRGLRLRVARS